VPDSCRKIRSVYRTTALPGHFSSAHLGASVTTTDWPAAFGLPRNLVKAGLCVSGIHDLLPVRLSSRLLFVNWRPST